jgi:hypothetical protein
MYTSALGSASRSGRAWCASTCCTTRRGLCAGRRLQCAGASVVPPCRSSGVAIAKISKLEKGCALALVARAVGRRSALRPWLRLGGDGAVSPGCTQVCGADGADDGRHVVRIGVAHRPTRLARATTHRRERLQQAGRRLQPRARRAAAGGTPHGNSRKNEKEAETGATSAGGRASQRQWRPCRRSSRLVLSGGWGSWTSRRRRVDGRGRRERTTVGRPPTHARGRGRPHRLADWAFLHGAPKAASLPRITLHLLGAL